MTTATIIICAWCQQPFQRPHASGPAPEYCGPLHQNWAYRVARGDYPKLHCPRCSRHDLCIAAPDWAICQTCGYQTDQPHREPGTLTPRGSSLVVRDLRERLGLPARIRRA